MAMFSGDIWPGIEQLRLHAAFDFLYIRGRRPYYHDVVA